MTTHFHRLAQSVAAMLPDDSREALHLLKLTQELIEWELRGDRDDRPAAPVMPWFPTPLQPKHPTPATETMSAPTRWLAERGLSEVAMPDNHQPDGRLGAILGALIVLAVAIFLLSGGENFGKKTVSSDADLPPVARGAK